MTRKRRILVAALALVSGAVAGLAALRILESRPPVIAAAGPPPGTTTVVVAARDLPLGTLVAEDDVRMVEWPDHALPEGFASLEAQVVGRGLVTPAVANEPLIESKLADRGDGGLPILIPEGMRAMSVKVDEVIGVAGFVLPGTVVDVVSTLTPPDGPPTTRVILQRVRTLAAGQAISRDAEGEPMTVTVITLLVSPEDAEHLALAAAQGRIQLALRNTLDAGEIETNGVQVAGLLGRPATRSASSSGSRPRATSTPAPSVIEVYRGGVRTLVSY